MLCCVLLLAALPANATSEPWYTLVPAEPYLEEAPVLRALLIGCDTFAEADSLAPSAAHNVEAVRAMLEGDLRGYASIRTSVNERMDGPLFERLVEDAFVGAKDNDISLFYICTHGIAEGRSTDQYTLLLSGSQTDYRLSGRQLCDVLSRVPGEKVVWVDACYSGMLIGRAVSIEQPSGCMAAPHFQVMTSSGGRELSYFWNSAGMKGGSYLVTALEHALTPAGRFAADADKDMRVTMGELEAYLDGHYGPSTAQFYPSAGDFALLHYALPRGNAGKALVSDLVFDETRLTGGQREIGFSYTLNRRARIAYQLVYEKNGTWQFDHGQVVAENEGRHGIASPGRIRRSLHLQEFGVDLYGYVLFMVMAVDEDRMEPLATALLSVEEENEDPPEVYVGRSFAPDKGEEAVIFVGYEKPCLITVAVRNEQGDVVAYPVYERMSRPQHLDDMPGSLYYWRGVDSMGEPLPKGGYSLQITLRRGNRSVDAFSRAFSID